MDWFTGAVLYALIWWVVLFAVLPFGVRPEDAPDAASGWRGAPARPRMGRKLLWTTLVATLVWAACVGLIESGWISFRSGFFALQEP